MPLLTVIIPLYNKRHTVIRALNSVLAQTVQEFEIIVVNDGSTDGGEKLVEVLIDHRIRMLHQNNHGVSAARNLGIKAANTELVAFLDADDEWLPQYLGGIQMLLSMFPSCDIFATSYEYIYTNGQSRLPAYNGMALAPGSSGILENYFDVAARSDPPLWTSAVVARKLALEEIKGFPEGIVAGEDLLTWARLAARGGIAYLNSPLVRFHFPVEFSDRPERYAQSESCGSPVLEGLLNLSRVVDSGDGPALKNYIGRVAEMAAVVAIGNGHYAVSRKYVCLAWGHGKRNAKMAAVFACSLIRFRMIGQKIWAWLFHQHVILQSRKICHTRIRGDIRP
jgi:glycosyltransferase involved in cell wall biosynthesis